jgi:hypothetical protein
VHPAPLPEASGIDSCIDNLWGNGTHGHHCASSKLVGLHSFVNIMCHNAPHFRTNSKEIVESLSLWNLLPIGLSLAPAMQVNLEVLTQVINCRYFSISQRNAQAVEVLHCYPDQMCVLLPQCMAKLFILPYLSDSGCYLARGNSLGLHQLMSGDCNARVLSLLAGLP